MVWWDISLPISERKYDQTLSTCLISQDRPEPGYFWAMVKTVFLIFSLKGGAHPPKKNNNKIQIHLLGIRIRRNPIHDGGMTRGPIFLWFLTVAHLMLQLVMISVVLVSFGIHEWFPRKVTLMIGPTGAVVGVNTAILSTSGTSVWSICYPRENKHRPFAPFVDDFPGETMGFSHLC